MTTREFLLTAWDWNSLVIGAGILAFLIYGFILRWKFTMRSLNFIAGLALALIALASPLNLLSRGYLFSAHMLQHLLLVLAVPPLVLLSLPKSWNPSVKIGKFLSWAGNPLPGWLAGVGAMWFWHVPAICDAAASSEGVHAFQTFSLLVMGAMFWWPIIGPREEGRLSPLPGILYLFSACAACSLLGIWISFAPVAVCPMFMKPHARMDIMGMIQGPWGLTPAADQQIGGLLMWVPACFVYLGGILALLGRFYRRPGKTGLPPVLEKEGANA